MPNCSKVPDRETVRAGSTTEEMKDILIGGGDWPTDYYHGFDETIAMIAANLSDAEIWAADTCITGD
jgi:hypothetical protein